MAASDHLAHMAAGALAGVMEHITMFPIDTVKTRLQIRTGTAPLAASRRARR